MALRIYGAGMAGLIAAHMLRRQSPAVFEAQTDLPDNHGALLRFRSAIVQDATGIPLKRVPVFKAVKTPRGLSTRMTLQDANRYSTKVTGSVMPRSIINLDPCERYVAPVDFLPQLHADTDIRFSMPLTGELIKYNELGPIISTIPMPALMELVDWPDRPEFKYLPIRTWRGTISSPHVDVYQTIYYPHPSQPYYRASITGNLLMIESAEANPDADDVRHVVADFGLPDSTRFSDITIKHQKYGKLLPIDERLRRAFITEMSDRYNVYSLGRFATWRQILLDDVVRDVKVVSSFLDSRDHYARRRHYAH